MLRDFGLDLDLVQSKGQRSVATGVSRHVGIEIVFQRLSCAILSWSDVSFVWLIVFYF